MPDDDPKTNDEPKTGYSILEGEGDHALRLSYPLGDGRSLTINLDLNIQPS